MSENNKNMIIKIGMKNSDKVFIIRESNSKINFHELKYDLIECLKGNDDSVSIINSDLELIYASMDSIAYIEMITD
ncbi:hypothetical protein ACWEVF_13355 [Staphylococcus xylosus]|uniref:hypothetical protein n=1 Tax=Staphylococcus equorum TaxID=246432 RepID=UPI000E69CBB7|nr:hypothetical protein [Staphylococcus equorum]RIL27755.1 hypothetical protein BUY88_11455 [Staphylococcus equorum]